MRIAEIPACRGRRWWRHILDRKWKYGRFANAQLKCNPYLLPNRRNICVFKEIGDEEHDIDVRFSQEQFCYCIIVDFAVGRYHVSQNIFLVIIISFFSSAFLSNYFHVFSVVVQLVGLIDKGLFGFHVSCMFCICINVTVWLCMDDTTTVELR